MADKTPDHERARRLAKMTQGASGTYLVQGWDGNLRGFGASADEHANLARCYQDRDAEVTRLQEEVEQQRENKLSARNDAIRALAERNDVRHKLTAARGHIEALESALLERGHTDECHSGELTDCDCPLRLLTRHT